MPVISVIIPIYNSEQHIEKCLKSVADQEYQNFEVLMIDDGSTDCTAEICKHFANIDNRFKYFYKENGGVSSARNFGLSHANGEFIAFIDSDDFVNYDYLQALANPLNDHSYSIVQSGIRLIRNGTESVLLPPAITSISGIKYIELVLKREIQIFLFQSPTSKLYSRKLLVDSGATFNEKISISEDCLFNTELLNYVTDNICFINYAGYNYLQDNSTLTRKKANFEKTLQSIEVGIKTSAIRNDLIKKHMLQNDLEVKKGFSQAICIIYLSNAHQIETGHFTNDEKEKLYSTYFSAMNYPILPSVNEYKGTDRTIIEESFNKKRRSISRIYQLREKKSKVKKVLHLR